MYFPIMGTMKGAIVPESKRSAIYNLFRVPLNFIVLFSLLTNLSPAQSFSLNSKMLTIASILQYWLMKRRAMNGTTQVGDPDEYIALVSQDNKKDSQEKPDTEQV